jgi:hypothetical protein
MTGHNAFTFTEEEVENLREFIERGGTVILDDCLPGEGAFGPCVERSQTRGLRPQILTDSHRLKSEANECRLG